MVRVRHTTLVLITAAATIAVIPSTPAAAAVAPCVTGNGLRATALLPATAVTNGYYGSASATGDFNGDGYTDAAIGHHGNGKGSVDIYHGSPTGLARQTTLTPASTVTAAASFGGALAVGDFNGDGKDDLAVGAPAHSNSAGVVQSFTGGAEGLSSARSLLITQELAGDKTEAGDRFGSALAAGDFNGDGKDDLAIGADEEAQGSTTVASGQVTVVRGNATNLERAWIITQTGIGQTVKAGDEFGISLAAGQVVGDAKDDLVVGARGKDIGSDVDTGAIFILDGAGNKTTSNPIFKGQGGSADESGDRFGSSVAIGDFNGDGKPDVAAGAPFESGNPVTIKRGAVEIFHGPVTKDSTGYFVGPTDQSDATANNDSFGSSLTAGDLDRDGVTDLLVGAVLTPRNTLTKVGAVSLFSGVRNANLRAERTIVPGDVGAVDQTSLFFGGNTALGDFNKDNRVDAVIGAHGRNSNGASYLVDGLAPATAREVQRYAPTAALQSPPVGTRTAPIRYAYTDNVGGPRLLTQTEPRNAGSIVRDAAGPSEAVLTGKPAIGQFTDGRGVVAFRSITGDLWVRTEATPDNTAWGAWVNYGGQDLSGISMVTLSTGKLAVFGVTAAGELAVLEEKAAGGSFGVWRGTGLGHLTGDPVTVVVPGGIRIFVRDLDGNLRTALWTGSAITGCTAIGDRGVTGTPAVVVYPGSRLRVFATTPDQQLVTAGQDAAGAFDAAWSVVQATGVTGSPAAVFDRISARTTVMARTADNHIWGATETAQGSGTFGNWTEMSASEAYTEVTAVPYTSDGLDSYYFTVRDINNVELILSPGSQGLRTFRMPQS
jgi:hypothetical protein